LKDGGYQTLLDFLLTFDLDGVDLWAIPRTQALLDQQLASLQPVEAWWFECLQRGWIEAQDGEEEVSALEMEPWAARLATERVYASYLRFCDRIGVRHKLINSQMGEKLRHLAPGIMRTRPRGEQGRARAYQYIFPNLATCRNAFAAEIGADIDWNECVEGEERP
jgi:hypothetical protein